MLCRRANHRTPSAVPLRRKRDFHFVSVTENRGVQKLSGELNTWLLCNHRKLRESSVRDNRAGSTLGQYANGCKATTSAQSYLSTGPRPPKKISRRPRTGATLGPLPPPCRLTRSDEGHKRNSQTEAQATNLCGSRRAFKLSTSANLLRRYPSSTPDILLKDRARFRIADTAGYAGRLARPRI